MSKELSPLEALEFITSKCCLAVKYAFKDELKIIETALKDYEETDNQIYDLFEKFGINHRKDLLKKLNALEIIKKKGCLQFCMLGVSLEDYNHSVDIANKDYGFERYKHYNQEEFDLVKEELK